MSRREAEKAVMNIALDTNFAVPGDAGFPLNQAFEAPRDRNEAETLRQYIMQMRQELAQRLLSRVYADDTTPSKVKRLCVGFETKLIIRTVVAELHEAKVYEQVIVGIDIHELMDQ
jgi:hypothetical protein